MKAFARIAGALLLALSTPATQAAEQVDTQVQLLAINDLHGHLAPNTPGTIQVGCCNPTFNSSGVQTGWTQRTVPAGAMVLQGTGSSLHFERECRRALVRLRP